MKIQIFRPQRSYYGALVGFCDGLFKGFKALKAQVEMIAFHDKTSDLTIGFNGPQAMPDGRVPEEHTGKIHVALLVDAPWRFMPLLGVKKFFIGCVDESYLRFTQRIKDEAFFCPHAIDSTHPYQLNRPRPYKITFPATYVDIDDLNQKIPKGYEDWIENAVEEILSDSDIQYLDYFQKEVIALHRKDLPFEALINSLETRLRYEGQIRLLKALKGQDVHLFGKGIEKLAPFGFKIHGEKTYFEMRKIFEESEFVVNTSPKMKSGGHERIFESIAAGARIITDLNPFLSSEFGTTLDFFEYNNLPALNQIIASPKSKEKAYTAREIVMERFAWKTRAEQILKLVQEK